MRMALARDNIEGIRTAEDDTSFVGAPFKLTFGNVARETLRLAKVERLPFVHDELAEGFAVEAGVPDLRVVLGRIQDLCSGLGLPRLPAVIVRSDDDMSEIGFYELYRVLIYPGLHEMPAVRMRDVRRKQRAVRQVGPDDWKPLLEAAAMVDGMIK